MVSRPATGQDLLREIRTPSRTLRLCTALWSFSSLPQGAACLQNWVEVAPSAYAHVHDGAEPFAGLRPECPTLTMGGLLQNWVEVAPSAYAHVHDGAEPFVSLHPECPTLIMARMTIPLRQQRHGYSPQSARDMNGAMA